MQNIKPNTDFILTPNEPNRDYSNERVIKHQTDFLRRSQKHILSKSNASDIKEKIKNAKSVYNTKNLIYDYKVKAM